MINKKRVIIIQGIVIVFLAIIIMTLLLSNRTEPRSTFNSSDEQQTYCEKNFQDTNNCLLSPRVYTNITPAKSFLIINLKPLQQDIQKYINENDLNMSVYILNLRDSASFGINSSIPYEPASLNKLPVAIVILKKVEEGKLTLDTVLPITDDERDNSSGNLYASKLKELSVKDLLKEMLSNSDNTALWVLGRQITLNDLKRFSDYLNYYQNDIDYKNPENNTYKLTTKSTGNIFLSLYLSTTLEPEHSEMILNLLKNTSFNINKYAKLPKDVTVSQKYGAYFTGGKKELSSCGIMYVKDSRFFYCVMNQNLEKEKAEEAIGTVVNKLYNFIIEGRKTKDINL